jgi:UDP-N-acetylmuramate dehydrogenase
MKATGIVRRIDDLGRVVIPKEIRRTMRIREGDPLEIFTDRDGEVIFKKYSPIGELTGFAAQYAETLHKTCEMSVVICDRDSVVACAGVSKKEYGDKSLSEELSGLECCAGIPGTVGGALSMDAGSRHEWIGRVVRDLVTYRPGVGMRRYLASEIEWGYRTTSIPAGEVILEATFGLEPGDRKAIGDAMDARLHLRHRSQPVGKASCGSVFKNPGERSTGLLVQSLGLKKFEIGGARVSSAHANFIVNMGDATAKDVIAVMTHVHDRVLEEHGIDLEPEVRLLGF